MHSPGYRFAARGFCPTRGEEKDRLCRTKDFWKHVRNLRPGCCQRLSFWACSPLAGWHLAGMPLQSSTPLQSVAAQLKTAQQSAQQDMSSLKDRLAQDEKASTDLQGDLKVVTGKLKITQGQLKKAREEAA